MNTKTNITILIAEDDANMAKLLQDIIIKIGYEPLLACNGEEAENLFFLHSQIDLVILDVMMPKKDGWHVLSSIRRFSDVPVIMLTALGDERNEVAGLLHGANDYISKPFSYTVLTARIETLLRRVKKDRGSVIQYGKLIIKQENHKVFVGKTEILLNHKEYELLCMLVHNAQIVLSRDTILNKVWGYDYEGESRTIDTHIKTLRAKLGECGTYIKTKKGTGYIFEVVND